MASVTPPHPDFVYRLLTRDEWDAATPLGHYPPTALDRSSGFIHLSTLAQSADTANLYFAQCPSLLLLQLPTAALEPHLTWDAVPKRPDSFPHYHAPHIPLALITQLSEVPRLSLSSPFTLPSHLPSLPLLYKIASAGSYAAARSSGAYHGNAKDAADGFVHLATAAQLAWVSHKFRSDTDDLVLMSVDLQRGGIEGHRVLWEAASSLRGKDAEMGFDNLFAHVYDVKRGIPAQCILRAQPIPRSADGALQLPSLT